MPLCAADGETDARAPVIAEGGQLCRERERGVGQRGDGRRQLLAFPAQACGEHSELAGLPLGGGIACPVVGAQMPVGGAHGLRIIGIAGQIAETA